MLLWFAFAVLTAAVLAAVLAPLARAEGRPEESAEAGTFAVYRDQLDEIEAERARGIVDEAEAAAARIEVSRRLLASSAASERESTVRPGGRRPQALVPVVIVVAVPMLTIALYLAQGSPGVPSFPLAARSQVPLEQTELGALIARVEAHLRAQPDDGDGWEVIAPIYFKIGRLHEAAGAFANAARLKGETVNRLGGFAEATVLAANGVVGEEARRAYEKILRIEPGRPEARFWLALAQEQDGKLDAALAAYTTLLADAPPDAPWRGTVQERIAELSGRVATPGTPPARGPSADDVAAASKLTPEDRAKMIAQMVEGLSERLKRDGSDLAGWRRLINAYSVLGREQDARTALGDARKAFAADTKALAELAALAKTLGLGS
jgi:cytochrome c-type biogenesis protein CcmH